MSRGKVLTRVFQLFDEVRVFLVLYEQNYTKLLANNVWVAKLVYLSDIFIHLNQVNRKLQARMKVS
jgi:hypothetical protein